MTSSTTPPAAADDDDEVVTQNPEDMVLVQLCFRKPGMAGQQNPHGYVKIELRQPKKMRRTWEQARQFTISQMPGVPGMNVVFDGALIKPKDAGRAAPSEADTQLSDPGEIVELAARREAMLVDIARLNALLDALNEQHIKARNHYGEEEKRLHAGLADLQKLTNEARTAYQTEARAMHDRVQVLLEAEVNLSKLTRDQMIKFEEDLRASLKHEAKKTNEVADAVAEARAQGKDTLAERLLKTGFDNAMDLLETPLGEVLIEKLRRW